MTSGLDMKIACILVPSHMGVLMVIDACVINALLIVPRKLEFHNFYIGKNGKEVKQI